MKRTYKVIFCLNRSFTNRDYQRFGCAYLKMKGYAVEAWNIDAGRYSRVEIPQGYYQGDNLRELSPQDTVKEIAGNAGAVFILTVNIAGELLLELKRWNCTAIMYWSTGSLEYGSAEIPKKDWPKRTSSFGGLIRSEMKKLLCKNSKSRHAEDIADYYILNTHQCLSVPPKNVDEERMYYIHTGDYDRYLESERKGISTSEELILYVDSGFGLVDIDSVMFGYTDPWRENPQEHSQKRNKIFEKLEEHYGLPVVIAGHPHTDYSNADFGGREIVFDQTCELTAKAKLVIMQWSTAVSYTMLFKKPVMILMDDSMIHHRLYHRWLYANYKIFDLRVCNMDITECKEEPWEYANVIVDSMRERYIHAFIKEEGTPEILSYEILEQIIQKIYQERG